MSELIHAPNEVQRRRIFYLVFATATLLVLGLIYAWSLFARPIGREYSAYAPVLSQVFQVSMFTFCVAAIIGAQVFRRVSPRAAILLAAFLLCTGFILTALCSSWGVWALFVFYGVIAASGCGVGYNSIISLVTPWFPDKPGLCSGVMMMGMGISSLVFGSLAEALFQVVDWTLVFYVIAVMGAAVMILLAFVVRPAPQDIARQLGMGGAASLARETPTKQQPLLKTRVFYLYSIWATIVVACGLALIGSAAQGAEALGIDAGFAALFVGLVSTMNGLARVINGALFDRLGLTAVMTLSAAVSIATMLGLSTAFALSSQGFAPVLYIVAGILVALPYGSVPVMAAAYTRQRYKAESFSSNLSIANFNLATGALLNIIITALLGATWAGNGVWIYGTLVVLAGVALTSVFFFEKAYKKDLAQIAVELKQQE